MISVKLSVYKYWTSSPELEFFKIDTSGARTFVFQLTILCFTTAPQLPCRFLCFKLKLLMWRKRDFTAYTVHRLTNKSPKTHVYGVTNNWRMFSSYIWRITVHINYNDYKTITICPPQYLDKFLCKNEGGGGGRGCCSFLYVEFVPHWQRIPYSVVHTDLLDCSDVEISHSITELKKKDMGI